MPYNYKREWAVPLFLCLEEIRVMAGSLEYLWMIRRGHLRWKWLFIGLLLGGVLLRRHTMQTPFIPDFTAVLLSVTLLSSGTCILVSELATKMVRGCLMQLSTMSLLCTAVYLLVGYVLSPWGVAYFAYWSFEYLIVLVSTMCATTIMNDLIIETKIIEMDEINRAIDDL